MSDLLKINVNEHTEKKGQLSYLSWAWAWAEVLKIDPGARWHATEYGDEHGCARPCMYLPDGSAMVKTEVTIKGETKVCLLPVMDHKNKAIKNPDAFAINTAIMRCMTKTIGMHGLGLYIYAGEDLPQVDASEDTSLQETLKKSIEQAKAKKRRDELDDLALQMIEWHKEGKDGEAIKVWYASDTFSKGPDGTDDGTGNEERLYVWKLLKEESRLRSTIKANSPERAKEHDGDPGFSSRFAAQPRTGVPAA